MNRITLFNDGRLLVINGVTGDVEDAAEDSFSDRNGDGGSGVGDGITAAETFSIGHGEGADPAIAKVLLHFANDAGRFAAEVKENFESVIDFRQLGGCGEIHVHDGTDDLDNFADVAHRKRKV